MKLHPSLLILTLAVIGVLTGCQSPKAPLRAAGGAAPSTRNNCYALLHQLLDDEKDVSMLRFIKREHSDVKNLVNKIAAASGAGARLLEELAREDPSINLNDPGLPPGETATRAAIASTKKKELLGHAGDEFELALLVTQAEALNYAWHLAKVAGENESRPDHARALAGLSLEMQNLYHEIFTLMLLKTESSGTNRGSK